MRKKIIAVTTALIAAISSLSIVGFLVHINKNYEVIKSTNECRMEIKEIQNDYVGQLYQKIISENNAKSLAENSDYYNDILNDCEKIENKQENLLHVISDNEIKDVNMKNYIADTKTFIVSVEKVYKLLEDGSKGNFQQLNNLSEEESSALINSMKLNYETLCVDYNQLKLDD